MSPMLEGWGRLPVPGRENLSTDLEAATAGAVLTRGLGRSYGDSSLPAQEDDPIAGTLLADRIRSFDPATGVLRAEAGLSAAAINRLFIPRGWFLPVTPGTKFVTLGGMVASDVHGKNHHREGCFGAHVRKLRMRLASNDIVECGPELEPELFWATVGGMGLLGHILEVTFEMRPIPSPWLYAELERVPDIDAHLEALARGAKRWPMTVGWIDCLIRGRSLGRGILTAGRWATPEEARGRPYGENRVLSLPFELPNGALNPVTARLFNAGVYWHQLKQRQQRRMSPDAFFYPLDAILHWNRAYGRRGFTQYQCVLPANAGPQAVHEFLTRLTGLGCASPLCVIKDCGPEGDGLLSFPMEGTSIAVDIPVSSEIQHIVDTLNEFVIATGGRIYLTKDRFTRPDHFRKMEPRLDHFLAVREKWDPARRLRSAQSVRLLGDAV